MCSLRALWRTASATSTKKASFSRRGERERRKSNEARVFGHGENNDLNILKCGCKKNVLFLFLNSYRLQRAAHRRPRRRVTCGAPHNSSASSSRLYSYLHSPPPQTPPTPSIHTFSNNPRSVQTPRAHAPPSPQPAAPPPTSPRQSPSTASALKAGRQNAVSSGAGWALMRRRLRPSGCSARPARSSATGCTRCAHLPVSPAFHGLCRPSPTFSDLRRPSPTFSDLGSMMSSALPPAGACPSPHTSPYLPRSPSFHGPSMTFAGLRAPLSCRPHGTRYSV